MDYLLMIFWCLIFIALVVITIKMAVLIFSHNKPKATASIDSKTENQYLYNGFIDINKKQLIHKHPVILCIAGNYGILESLKMIFKIKDYEIHTAEDGSAAWDLIEQNMGEYDVIISDYMMPRMDGIELLKKIKEKYPSVPVAIITAYTTESSRANAFQYGAYDYLRVPFTMEEMYALVDRGLKIREEARNKNV